jgi:acyl dehydratase
MDATAQVQAGQVIAPKTLPPVTQEQLRAYAEASGDPNPIHLDEAVAKKMGLPGVIAHGMLVAAFLAERAREFIHDELQGSAKLAGFQARFRAMTFLGDVLSLQGTIKSASDQELCLDLQAMNQRGEIAATALARIHRGT